MRHLTEIKKFDVLPGTAIEQAVEEGLRFVKQKRNKDLIVAFSFNGVEIKLHSFSTSKEEVDYYFNCLKERSKC